MVLVGVCAVRHLSPRSGTGQILQAPESRVARGTHLWILRKDLAVWKVVLVTWHPEA